MAVVNDQFCSAFFSALANRLRVRMLQELTAAPMTVNELAQKIGAERTLVSHNLAMLSRADLVSHRREGKNRLYSTNDLVVLYVFFLLDRVVCSRCSIRRTCAAIRQREIPPLPGAPKEPCKGCR